MKEINPRQKGQRALLRVLGPLVLGLGGILTLVGVVSFFSGFAAFGSSGSFGGPPKYFFCAFIGMPLMGVGGAMCKFAFMGPVARYSAGELAPVAKDTINYLARETKEEVSALVAKSRDIPEEKKGSIKERLQTLEALKRDGMITLEDFEEQKDRILDEI